MLNVLALRSGSCSAVKKEEYWPINCSIYVEAQAITYRPECGISCVSYEHFNDDEGGGGR